MSPDSPEGTVAVTIARNQVLPNHICWDLNLFDPPARTLRVSRPSRSSYPWMPVPPASIVPMDGSSTITWLVVSNPLKNISQLGWLFPIYGKITNVPNHQPAIISYEIHFCYFTLVDIFSSVCWVINHILQYLHILVCGSQINRFFLVTPRVFVHSKPIWWETHHVSLESHHFS